VAARASCAVWNADAVEKERQAAERRKAVEQQEDGEIGTFEV